MIFEDIANVMNARPVKEIMRKTGLTKNRVYSLRMGCTFHMDYELLFALQRMGYEVRVVGRGATLERSESGVGQNIGPGGADDRTRGFAAGEMRPNGSKGRVFAVGDPARRSRDGDGKILVRGGEAMAAKRTTAQGGFAQRNAAPDFARQTQKVGPVTARAVSRSEMEPNGDKRRVVGRGATLERSESGVGQNIGPGGADDRTRGFAAGETEA